MRRLLFAAFVLGWVAIVALVSPAEAGRFNQVLNTGDAAPDWQGIKGVDGREHSLADYRTAKAIVLVFTSNHCPYANSIEGRLIELQKSYGERGLQVIAVSVSTYEEDGLEEMKKRSAANGFNFPYLQDATQKIGRDYGATCTPHVFLLDGNRKIAYMGAIDDGDLSKAPAKHYLREAIDAVLNGTQPPRTETKQRGCTIQYE